MCESELFVQPREAQQQQQKRKSEHTVKSNSSEERAPPSVRENVCLSAQFMLRIPRQEAAVFHGPGPHHWLPG